MSILCPIVTSHAWAWATSETNWFNRSITRISFPLNVPSGPIDDMHKNGQCSLSTWDPTGTRLATTADAILNLPQAHQFAAGKGQTVAVIDSGVHSEHLNNLLPGTDFIISGDGHSDCDGQGTLVAGIVGGKIPNAVAPKASILPIRWMSQAYHPRVPPTENMSIEEITHNHAITTLAGAIVYAADHGASVILISQFLCIPRYLTPDITLLRNAIHYAVKNKDAVIIAAAGDTQSASPLGSCTANTSLPFEPSWTYDPVGGYRAHDHVPLLPIETIAVPAWFPEVLAVAAVTARGSTSPTSLSGPWLGIAAPGNNIISLANTPNRLLSNSFSNHKGGYTTLNSSAYAAAYVAGSAALIRERYPHLSAAQIIHRLEYTAHSNTTGPNNSIGYGVVDPLAALTWSIPAEPREIHPLVSNTTTMPGHIIDHHRLAKIVTAAILAIVMCALIVYRLLVWMNGPSTQDSFTSTQKSHDQDA